MTTVQQVVEFLEEFAPGQLAESWDNVGLLVGRRSASAERIMTCLTLTEDVADEAIRERAQVVVTHHPILFRPVQRLTDETSESRTLLKLVASNVAVYSPHTSYDSAAGGINRQLAELLDLRDVQPLRPCEETAEAGGGRFGRLPSAMRLADFNHRVKAGLRIPTVQCVGDLKQSVERVAVACGSAAEFLSDAGKHGCDVLLTGEARFHACLEARSQDIALVLAGHYATERPALERLAEILSDRFTQLTVWASRDERDPISWC